ncbi:MAG: hypothetical protein AAFV85_05450 [Cyanobacteria bacterium J06634_6]
MVDAASTSTYCYLLKLVDHRDEDTWGYHLLDVMEQGFDPDYTIADGGTSATSCWPLPVFLLRSWQTLIALPLNQSFEKSILFTVKFHSQISKDIHRACG